MLCPKLFPFFCSFLTVYFVLLVPKIHKQPCSNAPTDKQRNSYITVQIPIIIVKRQVFEMTRKDDIVIVDVESNGNDKQKGNGKRHTPMNTPSTMS